VKKKGVRWARKEVAGLVDILDRISFLLQKNRERKRFFSN
jgi:hypothetical protein